MHAPHDASTATAPIRRVLVLGAGIAGLAAARALAQLGYDVVVVEARDRLGGRCWTVDRMDLGAHWIHSTEGNPLTTLAREFGLPTLFVGGDSTYPGGWEQLALQGPHGRDIDADAKLRSILAADKVRDALEAFRRQTLNAGSADMSVHAAIDRIVAEVPLTLAERRAAVWHLNLLIRDDCAADAEDLSFLRWDDGYEVYGYGDSILADGYGSLVDALARGLDIRVNHIVELVDYSAAGGPVRVTTSSGVEFEADVAIVTLPLGVLKSCSVAFNPPLSPAKRAAIDRLGVGVLNKVVAQFDEPFWPREQYAFGCAGPSVELVPTCVLNLWKTHKLPALAMSVGGNLGRQLESWSDTDVRAWIMQVLESVFGAAAVPPRDVQRTRWQADPFARGAYAYVAVNSTPADFDTLAEPACDRLFFAGEATVRQHWATVHSAYVSGVREAARISGRRDILPPRQFTENRRWREMMQRANRFFNVRGRGLPRDEMAERLAVLSFSPVFASVPPAELEVLATMFDIRSFADGEYMCTAGDTATEMYVIARGAGRVELTNGSVGTRLERGDALGEYGLFGAGKRTASVCAEGATVTYVLDYQRFQRFLFAFPEALAALMASTVQRLQAHEAQN